MAQPDFFQRSSCRFSAVRLSGAAVYFAALVCFGTDVVFYAADQPGAAYLTHILERAFKLAHFISIPRIFAPDIFLSI